MYRLRCRLGRGEKLMGTVDIQFTGEGVSATHYGENNEVLDEAWYTWAEVDELKEVSESAITFEAV